jgi:hypothetical protein
MSADGFRAVCDEMVGLGVLSRGADGYRLRSPNVLRLLGSQEQISDTLLEMTEEPALSVYDPTEHRPPHGDPPEPAPLSAAQLADIFAPLSQVRLVVGTPLSGVDDVGEVVATMRREGVSVTRRNASDRGATGAFASSGASKHAVAVIDLGDVAPDRSIAVYEQALAATQQRRGATLGVVIVAGPKQLDFAETVVGQQASGVVELARYRRSSLKAAATDLELVVDDNTVSELLSHTGGWFNLVNKALGVMKRSTPESMLTWAAHYLDEASAREAFLAEAGLAPDSPLRDALAMFGDLAPDGADEATLAEVLEDAGLAATPGQANARVGVLRTWGALEPSSDGLLRPEPVLRRALAGG